MKWLRLRGRPLGRGNVSHLLSLVAQAAIVAADDWAENALAFPLLRCHRLQLILPLHESLVRGSKQTEYFFDATGAAGNVVTLLVWIHDEQMVRLVKS
jgi:hypothetical protein